MKAPNRIERSVPLPGTGNSSSAEPLTGVKLAAEHEGEVARVRVEILVRVGIFPVLEVSGRRRQLQSGTLEVTFRRPDEAVPRVADPAGAADQRNIVGAELVLKNEVTLRAVRGEEEFDLFRAEIGR